VRYKKADGKPAFEPRFRKNAQPEFKPEPASGTGFKAAFKRTVRPEFQQESKADFKPGIKNIPKSAFKPTSRSAPFQNRTGAPAGRPGNKPGFAARPSFPAKARRPEPPVTDYVLPPRKSAPEPESAFNPDYKPGFRTGAKPAFRNEGRSASRPGSGPGGKPDFRNDRPGKPFRPAGPRKEFARPAPPADDDWVPTKTPGFRIEPVEDKPRAPRSERPFSGGASSPGSRPFRPASGRPSGGDRPFKAPFKAKTDRPDSGDRPFRPRADGPGRGPARSGGDAQPFRGRPASTRPDARPGEDRPRRFTPRTGGPPNRSPDRRPKPFGDREDRPREFRPRTERTSDGPPKKFASSRPAGPAAGGRPKAGPDGEPRKKERWRNSFTGKNKGRPKPKPKTGE